VFVRGDVFGGGANPFGKQDLHCCRRNIGLALQIKPFGEGESMLQNILLVFIFMSAFHNAQAGAPLQSTVQSYSSWKAIHEGYSKDCAGDAKQLSTPNVDPKTMQGATIQNLRWTYIPTTIMYKDKLDATTLQKLNQIDKVAKEKALEVLKTSKKMPLEIAQKSTGLGLVTDAKLTPENFLRSFNYKSACECLHNTANVVNGEPEYNKLSMQDFMIREEHNKVKCFVQNASL
jgi:hypothetical protein